MDDGFFGEEGGGVGNVFWLWIVDLIDGMVNFVCNIFYFCIVIVYVENGCVEFGVIYNFVFEEFYFVCCGYGVILNGKFICVLWVVFVEVVIIELGWLLCIEKSDYFVMMNGLFDFGFNVWCVGLGVLGFVYVVDGCNEVYVECYMNFWDCVVGLLMVEEVGGCVCLFEGDEKILCGGLVFVVVFGFVDVISCVVGILLV